RTAVVECGQVRRQNEKRHCWCPFLIIGWCMGGLMWLGLQGGRGRVGGGSALSACFWRVCFRRHSCFSLSGLNELVELVPARRLGLSNENGQNRKAAAADPPASEDRSICSRTMGYRVNENRENRKAAAADPQPPARRRIIPWRKKTMGGGVAQLKGFE